MASVSSTTAAENRVVQQLADLLRNNGHRILHGDSKVCLTSESLNILNRKFQAANFNARTEDFDQSSRNPSVRVTTTQRLAQQTRVLEDLSFLYNFLQKILAVKIIHNSLTLQGDVKLSPF